MHRTQILIENWHHERLKRLSAQRGVSLSALIREILDRALETKPVPASDDTPATPPPATPATGEGLVVKH